MEFSKLLISIIKYFCNLDCLVIKIHATGESSTTLTGVYGTFYKEIYVNDGKPVFKKSKPPIQYLWFSRKDDGYWRVS